jgi:hypothetical protein
MGNGGAAAVRHVIGVFLAVIMAAVFFVAGTWGYLRLLRLPGVGLPDGGGSLLSNRAVLLSFGALLATGLLAGLLVAAPRISPLAAGLPGLALLGWSALFLVRVHRAVSLIPMRDKAFGVGFEAMGINGILALAGIALVVPLFIPSRWRSRGRLGVESPPPVSDLISSDWSPTMPTETYRDEPYQNPYQ